MGGRPRQPPDSARSLGLAPKLASLPPRLFGKRSGAPRIPKPPVLGMPSQASTHITPSHSTEVDLPVRTARASITASAHPHKRQSRAASAAAPPRKRPSPSPATRRSKPTNLSVDTLSIRNDRLGKLVSDLSTRLSSAASWQHFVHGFRGPSYLSTDLEDLNHPATPLLARWREHGIPVESTSEPWTLAQKDECIRRGCHPSATEHSVFLREEMAEFIENRF